MSDRIDELVAAIDANTLLQWDGKDVALVAAHELATIAREADKWRKAAEWLARSAVSCLGTRDCDVFFDEDNPDRERICTECRQRQLDRALAAVEQEEAE